MSPLDAWQAAIDVPQEARGFDSTSAVDRSRIAAAFGSIAEIASWAAVVAAIGNPSDVEGFGHCLDGIEQATAVARRRVAALREELAS